MATRPSYGKLRLTNPYSLLRAAVVIIASAFLVPAGLGQSPGKAALRDGERREILGLIFRQELQATRDGEPVGASRSQRKFRLDPGGHRRQLPAVRLRR